MKFPNVVILLFLIASCSSTEQIIPTKKTRDVANKNNFAETDQQKENASKQLQESIERKRREDAESLKQQELLNSKMQKLKPLVEQCDQNKISSCLNLKKSVSLMPEKVDKAITLKLCELDQEKYCIEMVEKYHSEGNIFISLGPYASVSGESPRKGVRYFGDHIRAIQKVNGGYVITDTKGETQPAFIMTKSKLNPEQVYSGVFMYVGEMSYTSQDGFERSMPKFKIYKMKPDFDWSTHVQGSPIKE